MVDEVEREPALDAEVALVGDVVRLRGDLHDPVRRRVDVEVQLAAHAAEGAGALDLAERLLVAGRGVVEELLVDRAGRADGETAAAELALRVEPRALPGRHDARLPAAALERERRALHHFLRVADAAVAEDAGVGVVAHQAVAVLVRLPLGIGEHERRARAELLGERDQLVGPSAGRLVQVLAEQHLGERSPVRIRRSVGRDDHARRDARRARGSGRGAPRRPLRTGDSRRTARACRRGIASG